MNKAVEPGLGEAQFSKEFGTLGWLEQRDFSFKGSADANHLTIFLLRALFDSGNPFVLFFESSFIDICHIEHRFGSDEIEIACGESFVVGHIDGASRLSSL